MQGITLTAESDWLYSLETSKYLPQAIIWINVDGAYEFNENTTAFILHVLNYFDETSYISEHPFISQYW